MKVKKIKKMEPTDLAYYRFIKSVNTLRSPIEGSVATAMELIGAKSGGLYLNSGTGLEPYFSVKMDNGSAKILFQNGNLPKDWVHAYENELVFIEKKEGRDGARYIFNTVFDDWSHERVQIKKPKKENIVVPVKIEEREENRKIGLLTFMGNRLGIKGAGIERFTIFMASVSRIIARIVNERFDSVTKLSKRFDGEALIRDCVSDYGKHGTRFSVLFIDIDDFKAVNDRYGHEAGDGVLKEIAQRIKSAVRISPRNVEKLQIADRVFRWGGEEMIVILQDTGLKKAKKIAERIRSEIEREDISGIGITCSIGVSDISEVCSTGQVLLMNEYEKKSIERDIVHLADIAMYKAKKTGKNKVVVAESVEDDIKFREVDRYSLRTIENDL